MCEETSAKALDAHSSAPLFTMGTDPRAALRTEWARRRMMPVGPPPLSGVLMAGAAVVIIIAKEKELVEHFRRAGAVTPSNAKSVTELNVETRLAWRRLERRAIIRHVGDGRYYLDEPAWEAHQQTRKRVARSVLLIVLALLAVTTFVAVRVTTARL